MKPQTKHNGCMVIDSNYFTIAAYAGFGAFAVLISQLPAYRVQRPPMRQLYLAKSSILILAESYMRAPVRRKLFPHASFPS